MNVLPRGITGLRIDKHLA